MQNSIDGGLWHRALVRHSPKMIAKIIFRTIIFRIYGPVGKLTSSDPQVIGISGTPPRCAACNRIFATCIDLDRPFFLALQFARLQTSAKLECVLCSKLLEVEWTVYSSGSNPKWQLSNLPSEYITDMECPPQIYVCWFDLQKSTYDGCFPLYVAAFRGKRYEDSWTTNLLLVPAKEVEDVTPRTRQLETTTTADIVADLALKWIGVCDKYHKACHASVRARPMSHWHPTRLIHVGQGDQPPRLCDSTSIPRDSRYVTLSHCWGKDPDFLTLKLSNVLLFKESIPEHRLIKVFRDAFSLTRRLGIDYIWIDSLCIIQDSPRDIDWQRECATMGNAYKYAWLNIAATGFSDGRDGLYKQRGRSALNLQKVNLNIRNLSMKNADLCNGEFYLLEDFWNKDISNAPLNQRAWVFQERLLARRVLHIGARQIYWECEEQEACEIFPNGLPIPLRNGHKATMSLDTENLFAKQLPDESLRLPIIWQEIVSGYNAGALTKPTDKLVAISGIAKELGDVFKDEYVAGMWKSHLIQQLLWRAPHERAHSEKPITYQAPSWSWAAINEKVINPSLKSDSGQSADSRGGVPLVAIVNSETIFPSARSGDPSPFRQVDEGLLLRLRGRLTRAQFLDTDRKLLARVEYSPERRPLILAARKGNQERGSDASIIISPELHLDFGVLLLKGLLPLPVLQHLLESPTWPARSAIGQRNFWLLPLWKEGVVNGSGGNDGGEIEGLVLMHTRKAPGQYKRLGIFRLASPTAEARGQYRRWDVSRLRCPLVRVESDNIEQQLKALAMHKPFLEEPEDYEEIHGDGESTISIV